MSYPSDLKYTKEHEWVRITGETAEIGVTDFAQQQLGDVVYVDVPEPGGQLTAGAAFGTIESVKAVSELFAPIAGEIVDVNPVLRDAPESINRDPHGTWMVKVRVAPGASTADLLDQAQYEQLIAS